MITVKVLRVFANECGEYGNPVGIVVDTTGRYDKVERQRIAAKSGFSETVFINDIDKCVVRIFTPQQEIPFAGHALVGAVFFLEKELHKPVTRIIGSAGPIYAWTENGLTWARAELRTTPPWWHERLKSVKELEDLTGPQSDIQTNVQLWAWIDEQSGTVRSRTFAPGWGIPEDEANGSGCMRLAAALGIPLRIYHGRGSIIYARPSTPGSAEVGGKVVISNDLTLS